MLVNFGMMLLSFIMGSVITILAGVVIARWIEFEATRRRVITRLTQLAGPVCSVERNEVTPMLNEKYNRLIEDLRAEGVVDFELQGHDAAACATETIRNLISRSYDNWRPEVKNRAESGPWYCLPLKEEIHAESMTKAESMYPSLGALFRYTRLKPRLHTGRIEPRHPGDSRSTR